MSSYAKKLLWEALYCLVGSGSIQYRLAFAGHYISRMQGADLHDLSADTARELTALGAELTREGAGADIGTLEATTHTLTDEQGERIGIRILELYTSISGGI